VNALARNITCFVFAVSSVISSSAASKDVHTLKRFELAFRRAHAAADTHAFEKLVCRDDVDRLAVDEILDSFGRRVSYRIVRVMSRPYVAPRQPPRSVWNIAPTHRFIVWYALDRDQPSFAEQYVIGKLNGQYKFALATNRVRLPRRWVCSKRSDQTMQPRNSSRVGNGESFRKHCGTNSTNRLGT
jgi:hypothetical protein